MENMECYTSREKIKDSANISRAGSVFEHVTQKVAKRGDDLSNSLFILSTVLRNPCVYVSPWCSAILSINRLIRLSRCPSICKSVVGSLNSRLAFPPKIFEKKFPLPDNQRKPVIGIPFDPLHPSSMDAYPFW